MKLATIGSGTIVETFLAACKEVDGIELKAVYSRTLETGLTLADKFGIIVVFTDLEIFYTNDLFDTVYIASPNSLHFSQAFKALQAGKNVIIEKPFASTLKETDTLIQLAAEKNLFLFEAISVLYMPNLALLKEKLPQIFPLTWIESTFFQYSRKYDQLKNGNLPNVFNPAFSGGALMNLNIYPIHFIVDLMGKPTDANYTANCHENGIDLSGIAVLRYPGVMCTSIAAKDSLGLNNVQIHGSTGTIVLEQWINGLKSFYIDPV